MNSYSDALDQIPDRLLEDLVVLRDLYDKTRVLLIKKKILVDFVNFTNDSEVTGVRVKDLLLPYLLFVTPPPVFSFFGSSQVQSKDDEFKKFNERMIKDTINDIPTGLIFDDVTDVNNIGKIILTLSSPLGDWFEPNKRYKHVIAQMKLQRTPQNKLQRLMVLENMLKNSLDTTELGIEFSKEYTSIFQDYAKVREMLTEILPNNPTDADNIEKLLARFFYGDINVNEIKTEIDSISAQIKKFLTEDCMKFTELISQELNEIEKNLDSDNEYVKYTFRNIRVWLVYFHMHCKKMDNLDNKLNYNDRADGKTYKSLESVEKNLLEQHAALQGTVNKIDETLSPMDTLIQLGGDLEPEVRKEVVDDFIKNENIPREIRSTVQQNESSLSKNDLVLMQMVNSIQTAGLELLVGFTKTAEKFDNLDDMGEHFKQKLIGLSSKNPELTKLLKVVHKLQNRVRLSGALIGKGSDSNVGNQFMKILSDVVRKNVVRNPDGYLFYGSTPSLSIPIYHVVDSVLSECLNQNILLETDAEDFASALKYCLKLQAEIYKNTIKKHGEEYIRMSTKLWGWSEINDFINRATLGVAKNVLSEATGDLFRLITNGNIETTTLVTWLLGLAGPSGIFYMLYEMFSGSTRKYKATGIFRFIPLYWPFTSAILFVFYGTKNTVINWSRRDQIPRDITNDGQRDEFAEYQNIGLVPTNQRFTMMENIKRNNQAHYARMIRLIDKLDPVNIKLYKTSPPLFYFRENDELRNTVNQILQTVDAGKSNEFRNLVERLILRKFRDRDKWDQMANERRIVYLLENSISKRSSCVIS